MNSKTGLVVIVAALVVLAGGFFLLKSKKQTVAPTVTPTPSIDIPTNTPEPTQEPTGGTMKKKEDKMMKPTGAMMKSETKTFDIDASSFKFSVNEIKVKKGDKVKINLSVKDGLHDWVLDEFDAKTERGNTGETVSAEFTADKTGTFEYYCSVGKHRAMGMVGKLIVE